MIAESSSRWYVVRTQVHAEARAAGHLTRQGFGVYLPRYRKRCRHARRVEWIVAPLFPRYLFVRLDINRQRWRAVRSTVGVHQLIGRGDEPLAIADAVMGEIQRRQTSDGFVDVAPSQRFKCGDKVRVIQGALAACQGLFEGTNDEARVHVLLDMLGRRVRVVVDRDALEAA